MANFLLRKASERRSHRWNKKTSDGTASTTATNNTSKPEQAQPPPKHSNNNTTNNTRLPTLAMIQLLKRRNHQSYDSDTSTLDTTMGHEQQQQQLVPMVRPASSGTGLEINFVHALEDVDDDDEPRESRVSPRPSAERLPSSSPLTNSNSNMVFPSLHDADSTLAADADATDTPLDRNVNNNNNNNSDAPSMWQEFWQRCFHDCYCLSKSNKTNNSILEDCMDHDPSSESPEYFQFLPFCMEEDDLNQVIPKICEQLVSPSNKRSKTLRQLAQLCDRDHDYHRIPLVCNNEWNLVTILCESVLQDPNTSWNDYRQSLLILSNLTLPMENKAVLLLGPLRNVLLPILYQGLLGPSSLSKTTSGPLQQRQLERQLEIHLVCAIIFNLSFLQDGKAILLNYVPPTSTTDTRDDRDDNTNPSTTKPPTLLVTLEDMMRRFLPYATAATSANTPAAAADSVERQALRWTLGIMRNACQDVELARTLGTTTTIPQMALQLLQHAAETSPVPYNWKPQSLEDFALGMLVELALRDNEQEAKGASSSSLVPSLYTISCRDYLQRILPVGGIHGIRAQAIVKRFDASAAPSGGVAKTTTTTTTPLVTSRTAVSF